MGDLNQSAYAETLVASDQSNMPDRADRTDIMAGVIPTDMAGIQIPELVTPIRQEPFITPGRQQCAIASNYGDSFIFERVWVQPLVIDFGFIVEDSEKYIQVWNASRFDTVSVTDIVAYNSDGTLLTYDTLPNVLAIFGDINYLLNVYNSGPPLQDSTYKFTIAEIDYEVEVSGIRVLPFDLDPNWDAGIKIQYEYQTTIFTSSKLNEQRRPLSADSWFITSFTADAISNQSRINFNTISYGKDKVFGIPVFSEKIIPTSCTQGTYSIYTDMDLDYLYNLNNRTDYVILVDHHNGMAEVKLVNTIGDGILYLDQPISDDFQVGSTYIYPCMFCYLKSFKSTNITDDLTEVSVEFGQFKS